MSCNFKDLGFRWYKGTVLYKDNLTGEFTSLLDKLVATRPDDFDNIGISMVF
jgi:hypothetical protein